MHPPLKNLTPIFLRNPHLKIVIMSSLPSFSEYLVGDLPPPPLPPAEMEKFALCFPNIQYLFGASVLI